MRIQHYLRDMAGLEKAVGRGFRYYHTRCGTTALLFQLHPVSDKTGVDCGACVALVAADEERAASAPSPSPTAPPPVQAGALPEGEEADLSDFDALDLEEDDAHPASPPSAGRAEEKAPKVVREPYPLPDEPSMADICRRLGMDPSTDPEGKLGNLSVDLRTVLTEEERRAAGMVLGLVGGIPMAAPLVRTVYRLCHRLAWYESTSSPSAGGDGAVEE